MSREFVAASERANWQVAPSEPVLANYDDAKIEYRRSVEDLIRPIPRKSLLKKTFITISLNVLCADIDTKSPNLDPIQRDIYLPVEIALTKWNMAEREKPADERKFVTKHWIINPGRPTRNCVNRAIEHASKTHKIDFEKLAPDSNKDQHIEDDLNKVLREINSLLLPDRTVFSVSLRNCRQDLGALKWLVLQTGAKTSPIKVYSLEDLFVVVNRSLTTIDNDNICQGMASYLLHQTINPYEEDAKCEFHRELLRKTEEDCGCCAKALAECSTNAFLDNVHINIMASSSMAGEDH